MDKGIKQKDENMVVRDYQGGCYQITRFKKFVGKEKQMELKNELMDLYRKRP